MLKHYFLITIRNFWKYKIQNLIGIVGLSIGISFFTIGYNWLDYETSYDSFYPDSKHIYRIYGIDNQTGKKQDRLPLILADKLQQEFTEVEKITMFYSHFDTPVTWGEKKLGYPGFRFVDESFFKLFPPSIIAGKSEDLLYTPEELVITEDYAKKYWSTPEEAVGIVLDAGYNQTLRIVAVMANPPRNSNFQAKGFRADIFDRRNKDKRAADKVWFLMNQEIYVQLHKKADVDVFKKKLQSYTIDNKFNENLILKVAHITEQRHVLGSDLSFNINYIKTFVGAGLLLLLCAIFNFLNLFLNRVLQRIREIKLRKTVGAGSISIIKQLQIELVGHLAIVFVIGLCLLLYVIPFFEQKFETQILVSELVFEYILFSLIIFATILFICFLVEARVVRFTSLSQSFKGFNYKYLRNVSISLQLVICIFFLMSSFVFYRQVSFMNSFDWGFKKEGLIKMTMDANDRESIVKDIMNLPSVIEFIPTGLFDICKEPYFRQGEVEWEGKSNDSKYLVQVFDVGANFPKGFEIPILEGRTFQEQDILSKESDYGDIRYFSNKVLITKNLAKLIGKESLIDEKIRIPNQSIRFDGMIGMDEVEIIGVIEDFHTAGFQNSLYPVVLRYKPDKWNGYYYYNYVRVQEGTEKDAIKAMNEIFKKHYSTGDPEEPEIETVGELLDNMSKSEHASLQLFSVLSILCIVIAIFGIYSISSSNIDRRKREIAIRKVSGATTQDVIRMFLIEYSKLLIVANVVALPVAFYFMHNWLTQYVYRISIEFWMFMLVLAFTLFIVISTVLFQVIKAARRNPAEVMKTE